MIALKGAKLFASGATGGGAVNRRGGIVSDFR
jgi:hypothetical protein